MIDRFGFYFCDFPMRTNVQKQTQNYLYLSVPIAEASDKSALNYLHHSALIAEALRGLRLDSATKIRITHYDIDTSLICYAA